MVLVCLIKYGVPYKKKKAISIISNPSSLQAEGDAGSIPGDETWKWLGRLLLKTFPS